MFKSIISSILLLLTLISAQGCKDSLEKAYSLGEENDPDDPSWQQTAGGAPKKPVIQCYKALAFGYYCLGSDIKPLLDQRKPLRQQVKDSLNIYDFRERRGLTTITTFQGKILSASRTDRPANAQTLMAIRKRIEALYGEADDRSTFTADTNTSRRMEFAVFNKTAKAHYAWPKAGWRIDAIWEDIRDIRITFLDEDLYKIYLANPDKKLKSQK